ncbi:hypothetical protein L7F22_004290 [Adiantum nelumboides]|nr:hypothetical protein [Adiantum nelumboides]
MDFTKTIPENQKRRCGRIKLVKRAGADEEQESLNMAAQGGADLADSCCDNDKVLLNATMHDEDSDDDLHLKAAPGMHEEMDVEVEVEVEEGEEPPPRHVVLAEGEIEKPWVQAFVRHHVCTLGLTWQDAAFHLPGLLRRLPPASFLRYFVIFSPPKRPTRVFLTDELLQEILEALKCAAISRQQAGTGVLFHDLPDVTRADNCLRLLSDLSTESTCFGIVSVASRRSVPELTLALLDERPSQQPRELKQLLLDLIDTSTLTCSTCSLTRLDLRGPWPIHVDWRQVSITCWNVTDLACDIYGDYAMREFLASRLHTRLLTLRLRLWSLDDESWAMLVLKGLADSNCTLYFLDCEFFGPEPNIWFSLIQCNSRITSLKALKVHSRHFNLSTGVHEQQLSEYLLSSHLVHLEVQFDHIPVFNAPMAHLEVQFDWERANALINNFSICSLVLHWKSKAAEAHAASLIRRNKLYATGQLFKEPQVKPNTAKLFLCGHAEVGKTTLCHALHRTTRFSKNCICNWLTCGVSRVNVGTVPKRTRGMEFHSLSFDNSEKKLLICDLGGQEEFHLLHHYFLTANNNDLFIVVCKYDRCSSLEEFQGQLDYWLRFIVSHRSTLNKSSLAQSGDVILSDIKPKVIVVVNFFEQDETLDNMRSIAQRWSQPMIEKFSAVLNFEYDEISRTASQSFFGLNARTGREVPSLKSTLKSLFRDFTLSAQPIPKLCYDISTKLNDYNTADQSNRCWLWPANVQQALGSRVLLSYSTILGMMSDGNDVQVEPIRIQAALQELHNQGFIVFFPSNNAISEDKDTESTLVITDTTWFCNKLVGSLLATHLIDEPRRACQWEWNKEDIEKMLCSREGCKIMHLDEILRYLQRLELCTSLDTVPGKRKGHLLFPALVKDEMIRYPVITSEEDAKATVFFGRRVRCKDSSIHLIPFGVFTRLQVKLHKEYGANNASFELGYGWVSFVKGNIGVVVRFGGEAIHKSWKTKLWIDILVFCPKFIFRHGFSDHHNHLRENPNLNLANKLMDEIKTLVYGTCTPTDFGGIPSVMLEECVLQGKDEESPAVPLSSVLEEVSKEGLQETYQEWSSQIPPTSAIDLLLPKEIEECVKVWVSALAVIEEEFSLDDAEDGCSTPEGQEWAHLEYTHSLIDNEIVNQEETSEDRILTEIRKLGKRQQSGFRSVERRQQKMFQSLNSTLQLMREDIWNLGKVLRGAERSIIANCSTRLLIHELRKDRAYPVYPYLADAASGKLAPLMALLGKRVVVHFMCESPTEGPHPVAKQKGKEVMLQAKAWVAKVARVVVPAVRIICCLARVAASIYLPSAQVFIPSPEAMVSGLGIEKEALQQVILSKALGALLDKVDGYCH